MPGRPAVAPEGTETKKCPSAGPVSEADDFILLPSYESVKSDKMAFVEATRLIHINTNPYNAKTLVQLHDREAVVVNPPALPLADAEMDRIYDLPYTRRPHPSYREPIPAHEMIKDSVTVMRGCFGGCTFCSITHQWAGPSFRSRLRGIGARRSAKNGRRIRVRRNVGRHRRSRRRTCTQMRSHPARSRGEVQAAVAVYVHPGPSANYSAPTTAPLFPAAAARHCTEPGVRGQLVASGVRIGLAQPSPRVPREAGRTIVGVSPEGRPEHTRPARPARLMKKAGVNDNFEGFARSFTERVASRWASSKQYSCPYYIASHPGVGHLHAMIDAGFVPSNGNGYRPDQVQDFIPAPFDVATCMFYTGIDPFTKQAVYVARNLRDRKLQRALLQFFKPENYFEVRKALEQAGRSDLIGGGCDFLSQAQPREGGPGRTPGAGRPGRPRRSRAYGTERARGAGVRENAACLIGATGRAESQRIAARESDEKRNCRCRLVPVACGSSSAGDNVVP